MLATALIQQAIAAVTSEIRLLIFLFFALPKTCVWIVTKTLVACIRIGNECKHFSHSAKACTFHTNALRIKVPTFARAKHIAFVEHLKFIRHDTRRSARKPYHYLDNHHYQQYCYGYCHLLCTIRMARFLFVISFYVCLFAMLHRWSRVNCNRMSNKRYYKTHSMTFRWGKTQSQNIQRDRGCRAVPFIFAYTNALIPHRKRVAFDFVRTKWRNIQMRKSHEIT